METRLCRSILGLLFVFSAGSAGARELPCPQPANIAADFVILDVEGLEARLNSYLAALCDCDEPLKLAELAPAEGRAEGARLCPGVLRVVSQSRETERLLSFMLSPREDGVATDSDAMVIFASFVDQHWVFSWPVESGPELHR